jgi:hypothetical protein
MKTIKTIFLVLTSGLWITSMPANAIEGNLLYESCVADEGTEQHGFCLGYIGATYQALIDFQGKECSFIKEKVPVTQLRDIAVKHFKENPEIRHYDAFGTLFMHYGKLAGCIPK